MIIYTDIRHLIVAGLLLSLTNFGWNYPLPLQHRFHLSGKRMVMTKKSCQDSVGNTGTCMFKYDCIRQKGVTLSTCVDGFLFGACCLLKEDSVQTHDGDIFSTPLYSNGYQYQNESTSSFYQVNNSTNFNNQSGNTIHSKETTPSHFYTLLSKDSYIQSTQPSNLFNHNENVSNPTIVSSENVNQFTTFKKPVDMETDSNLQLSLTDSSEFSFSTESTQPTEFEEESPTNNESANLFSHDGSKNNATETIYDISNLTTFSPESTLYIQLAENENKLTTVKLQQGDIEKEKENNSINYFDVGNDNRDLNILGKNTSYTFNKTNTMPFDKNSLFQSNLSSTQTDIFEKNKSLSSSLAPDIVIDLLKTKGYSILTGTSTVSPTEINLNNTDAEEYNIKYTTLIEENKLTNKNTFKITNEDTTTISTLKVQNENIFETSTKKKNSVLLYPKLTTTSSSDLLNSDYSTNSKHNELTALKQISNDKNTLNEENLIAYDTQPKSPYEATENSDLELSIEFYNATSDRKPTTKLIPIPILPWSANSILPESFQSVIAQLTEEEVTSPKNLFLDYTTQATPSININTFDAQNSFLDSDERVNLEFKSDKITGYAYDNGQNENNSINKLNETENFNESDLYSYIETFVSTVTLNTNSIDDSNKNTIPISNVSKGNVTNYEFSTKPTENYDSEISEMNFVTKFVDNKTTTETVENSTDKFKNEEFADNKSSNIITKYNDLNNELLESNFTLYNTKNLFLTQTETYEPTTAKPQDNSYQIDSKISHNEDLLNKDLLEIPNFSTSVHNQTWYDPLFNITELTTTWTEEMTTNNPPTIIQIINNHAGNNLSSILLSSTVKDVNEPHVNTIAIQEHYEIKENITISPTVNNNLESSYDYYDFETLKTASSQLVTNLEDINQSHNSLIYTTVNTDISSYFSESVDSSQNSSLGNTSSHVDINSTNNLSSLPINNFTSPFITTVETVTADVELFLNNSEKLGFFNTDFPSKNEVLVEDSTESFNLISVSNFINSKNSSNEIFENSLTINVENEPTEPYSYGSTIYSIPSDFIDMKTTPEVTEGNTSLFTTFNEELSESAASSPTIASNVENVTTESPFFQSTITNINTEISTVTSPLESFIYNFSQSAETSQIIDFTSINELFMKNSSNQSFETPTVFIHETTALTTEAFNLNFTSQDEKVALESNATDLSTQVYTTPISTTISTTISVSNIDANKWNYKKDCGIRLMQGIGRIVGGKNTYFGKWPWQALVKEATWLGLFVKNKCGGVLITAKYVLTAAHCQPGFLASLLVVLGTHDLAETFDNKASIIRNVKRMVVHRHYNPQTFENDLALLEMESPVEFLPYVVPICLPHRKEDFTGKMAFVTGWGKLTAGGDVPNILQEVQVPIVTNEECQRMFYHAGHHKAIRSNFVCAGYTNGGQDSCEGDSGGPLMVQREDSRWVLVGTVSHGIGCADPNLPGVYMRMSSYRPWIDSIIYK